MGGRGATGNGGGGGGYTKTYEDRKSGGQVYTEKGRLTLAGKSKNERNKYKKEHDMCKTLAQNGHTVVHLEDCKHSDGTYDILIDGHKADLKRTKSANNIVGYAKHATRKQGAEKVVFQFDNYTPKVKAAIKEMQDAGIHGYYFVTGSKEVKTF